MAQVPEIGWNIPLNSDTNVTPIVGEEHKKKKKKHRQRSASSSSSSSSSDSSSSSSANNSDHCKKKRKSKDHGSVKYDDLTKEEKRKIKKLEKLERRQKRKERKIAKHEEKKLRKLNKSKRHEKDDCANDCGVPIELMISNAKVPETKAQYETRQSKIRRVVDPDTGRQRLIKGDGEVIEEIVSRARHKEINRLATEGDGSYFERNTLKKVCKR